MSIHPLAGKQPEFSQLVNIPKLVSAYYTEIPDVSVASQKVSFGTSGHRGSSFERSFNENHILAISQAICEYRKEKGIDGPLFLGMDTHALSFPALITALEVLAANQVTVMLAENDEYTPTPAISHAILTYNKGKKSHFADGIVITPSHNPPHEGGFKYNPPNGGPADQNTTNWIEKRANELLQLNLKGITRISYEKALSCKSTQRYPFLENYVRDLKNVIDFTPIQHSKISLGADPLGGAGVNYWKRIAEVYQLNLTIVNREVDPTFRFMTLDWDGNIRMDPSSSYAMQGLISLKDKFDIAFGCDTDHDRHGIVTPEGLMQPNNYLSAAIFYLFQHRPHWQQTSGVGKTIVSSQMIDRVTAHLRRKLYEVPVGFKWFVDGLINGSLSFVGEESAGGAFARLDGSVWTTDKDGIILSLLAAEMTAKTGKNPSDIYKDLTKQFGNPVYERFEAPATQEQKDILKKMAPNQIHCDTLAGEPVVSIASQAPGNGASIGGIKVSTKNGWFAARPSGTENIYKIYVESFLGKDHLKKILEEAQSIVNAVFSRS